MKLNRKNPPIYTHEGGKASRCNAEEQLRRSVLACLLWERTFYEDGTDIAERIKSGVGNVSSEFASRLAIQARSDFNLRHAPLWICTTLAKNRTLKADTLASVIQRADELTEFLAMYWKDGKCPLSAQVKKGLAKVFTKFDAYQLAKYNRPNTIKLRDVMFLVHPTPKNKEQAEVFKKLADKTLEPPDTWESSLVGGKSKKETFERLLKESKLGYMALLRNLRNMRESGVNEDLVFAGLNKGAGRSRVLPFRFISAAKTNPQWEEQIEKAMFCSTETMPKLKGRTVLLIDVSGSMDCSVSNKSDLNRIEAACALAILCREICDCVSIYTFSERTVVVPNRRGFALTDAIYNSQRHSGTCLAGSLKGIEREEQGKADRIIVFTDEESHDGIYTPTKISKKYLVNVASYENGVGYGSWTHITGFSEAIIRYIQELEREKQ